MDDARGNVNERMKDKVSWKSIQGRYKRLHEVHSRERKWNERESRFNGELWEMEELIKKLRGACKCK